MCSSHLPKDTNINNMGEVSKKVLCGLSVTKVNTNSTTIYIYIVIYTWIAVINIKYTCTPLMHACIHESYMFVYILLSTICLQFHGHHPSPTHNSMFAQSPPSSQFYITETLQIKCMAGMHCIYRPLLSYTTVLNEKCLILVVFLMRSLFL